MHLILSCVRLKPILGPLWIFSIILLVVLLRGGFVLSAQTLQWSRSGPEGIEVSAIAIHPNNASIMYVGTEYGGVYQTINGGDSWNLTNATFKPAAVNALVIDPSNPTVIYATTLLDGIYKSSDSGANWLPINTGVTATSLYGMAIDPSNSSIVYAATGGSSVYKTVNGGASWIAHTHGIFGGVGALAIDPTNVSIIYAAATYYPDFGTGGILKSTDGGVNWSNSNSGLAGSVIQSVVISPGNPSLIYAGGDQGVFKSTNGGANWTAINVGFDNSSRNIRSLTVDPVNQQRLYAGTEYRGVFRSIDGGANWFAVGPSLTYLRGLAISRSNPNIVVAGWTWSGGIFKSVNAGDTWSKVTCGTRSVNVLAIAVDPANSNIVYVGTEHAGLFKSVNGGASWDQTGLTQQIFVWAIAIDPTNPQIIYAGASSASINGTFVQASGFKSTDGGANWIPVRIVDASVPYYPTIEHWAIDPSNPAVIYAGVNGNSGVYKSTNGGATWTASGAGLTNTLIYAFALASINPAVLYAGTEYNGIFKSTNGGSTWEQTSLTKQYPRALAVDPSNANIVYAGFGVFESGLHKSTNGGSTWNAVNTGLPASPGIYALAIDPSSPTTLYAGGGFGVFKSSDGGANWAAFNDGLTNKSVRSLAIDHTGTLLHAGSNGGGVFDWPTPTPSTPYLFSNASNQVIAIDSVTFVGDPLAVTGTHNFSADQRTRVLIFTSKLGLCEPSSDLVVRAAGIPLAIEAIGTLAGTPYTYIVIKLDPALTGNVQLTVTLKGVTSNAGILSISP